MTVHQWWKAPGWRQPAGIYGICSMRGRMRFKTALAVLAGVLPASLVMVLTFLGIYAWPAIRFNGFTFVVSNNWNLGNL